MKIVEIADSKTDYIVKYVDNGVFLDGRRNSMYGKRDWKITGKALKGSDKIKGQTGVAQFMTSQINHGHYGKVNWRLGGK